MRFLLPLLAAGVVLGSLEACYGATQIELQLDTDVPCEKVRTNGVTILAASSPAGLATATPATESTRCDAGPNGRNTLGTLVLVPESGSPDLAIRIVLGVGRLTRDCAGASNDGCIVADRSLSYRKHESLTVPVRLDSACSAKQCAIGETCSDGECISSVVPCVGGACTILPGPTDAGVDDDGGATSGPGKRDAGGTCATRLKCLQCADGGLFNVCCIGEDDTATCVRTEKACTDAKGKVCKS